MANEWPTYWLLRWGNTELSNLTVVYLMRTETNYYLNSLWNSGFYFFGQSTAQNQEAFHLQWYKSEKSSTSSHLRSWNQNIFGTFALKNDLNHQLIIIIGGDSFSVNRIIIIWVFFDVLPAKRLHAKKPSIYLQQHKPELSLRWQSYMTE